MFVCPHDLVVLLSVCLCMCVLFNVRGVRPQASPNHHVSIYTVLVRSDFPKCQFACINRGLKLRGEEGFNRCPWGCAMCCHHVAAPKTRGVAVVFHLHAHLAFSTTHRLLGVQRVPNQLGLYWFQLYELLVYNHVIIQHVVNIFEYLSLQSCPFIRRQLRTNFLWCCGANTRPTDRSTSLASVRRSNWPSTVNTHRAFASRSITELS